MVATIGKGTDAQYYLKGVEYYTGHQQAQGIWLSGVPFLNVAAGSAVEGSAFENLHAGLGPDGSLLVQGGAHGRIANFDMTLSAPKSFSVIYAVSDQGMREALDQVQRTAAQAVVDLLNAEFAFIRRGHGGKTLLKAKLTVAAFQHCEARPARHLDGTVFSDPDVHTHLCIANIGVRESALESKVSKADFGALDGRAIYAGKMAAGAMYHATLAQGLNEIGLSCTLTGKNGIFEVSDKDGLVVPPDVKSYFSARQSAIEQRLSEYGTASDMAPQLASAVTRGTRLERRQSSTESQFYHWREQAGKLHFSPSRVAAAREASMPLSLAERKRLVAQRLAALPDQLTEHESAFEHRQLLAAVAAALVGTGFGPLQVQIEMDQLLDGKQLVALRHDRYGKPIYSTPQLVAIEQDLIRLGRDLMNCGWANLSSDRIDQSAALLALSKEQRQLVHDAAAGGSLVIVEGAAGSGKTTALKVLVKEYEQAGKTVIGAATAWRTAHMLRDELGVQGYAVDSLLAKAAGQTVVDANTVLLVDEAGQIGSRTMHKLLTLAKNQDAKIVLIGDRRQLQAISAGPAMQILSEVVEPIRLDTVVRQRETYARDAAADFSRGNAIEGLKAYQDRDLIVWTQGAQDTIKCAVDCWVSAQQSQPELDHLLLAKSNVTVRALNAEIRRRLRIEGQITGEEHSINAADASGRPYRLALAVGDKIRFGVRNDSIGAGVINGTVGTVQSISPIAGGNLQINAVVEGRAVSFSTADLTDDKGQIRLGHNLAITVYSAQGLSAESTTVVLDASFTRNETYVAMSRARGVASMVIDQGLLDSHVRAEHGLAFRHHPIDQSDRFSFLAVRLALAHLKSTTLEVSAQTEKPDLAAQQQVAVQRPQRSGIRGMRHGHELD